MRRGPSQASQLISAPVLFLVAIVLVLCGGLSAQSGSGTFYAPIDSPSGRPLYAPVAADLNGDGKLDLVGISGPPPYTDTNVVVELGNGDGTYQKGVSYAVGASPAAVEVGDVNGDGIPDLVVSNSNVSDPYLYVASVSVLLGNGDGTFQPQIVITLPQGSFPTSLVLGDFNGDGKLDVAVNGFSIPSSLYLGLAVLLGNGDGTFKPPVGYSTGQQPFMISAGDFNGDGKLDLVTGDYNASGGAISVLLGNGNGTFQSAIVTDVSGVPVSGPFVVADLNRDGKLDVGVGDHVLLGNGDGTFQTPKLTGPSGGSIEVSGDFNGDGIPDLVVVFVPPSSMYGLPVSPSALIYLGNGDGTFRESQSFQILQSTVTLGDANGDGYLDVITGDVSVTFGTGDGTFETLQVANGVSGDDSYFVLSADMNGDGRPDLVELLVSQMPTSSPSLGVLLGTGSGLSSPIITQLSSQPGTAAAGDLNGDGKMDLVVGEYNSLVVLLGNGDGTFQPPTNYFPTLYTGLAVADFNGDGKPDVIGVDVDNNIEVRLNEGNGRLGQAIVTSLQRGLAIAALVVADFNDDGNLDIAIATVIDSEFVTPEPVFVLLGNGDGTFQSPVQVSPSATDVVAGDFNGDGITDLAVFGGSAGLEVLLGNGNGTFQPPVSSFGTAELLTIFAGEFNGDGKLDLAGFGTLGISILLGNGDGTFQQEDQYGVNLPAVYSYEFGYIGPGLINVAIADFNGDGTQDIAAGTLNNTVSLLLNRPTGSGVTLMPAGINFGDQAVGSSSAAEVVTLSNIGLSALTIDSLAVTGAEKSDFVQTNTCGDGIGAGKSCSISVTFTPQASGLRTAAISVADNGVGSPQAAALSGVGTGLGLGIASGGSGSATVTAGQTANYTLSIGGAGVSGTATLSCTGAPSAATCSIPSGINVSATQATQFKVSVSTTGRMASSVHSKDFGPKRWWLGFAMIGLLILPVPFASSGSKGGWLCRWVRGLPLFLLLAVCSCGGGSGSNSGGSGSNAGGGTPTGTYTLTVSASAASGQGSVQLKLIVQ